MSPREIGKLRCRTPVCTQDATFCASGGWGERSWFAFAHTYVRDAVGSTRNQQWQLPRTREGDTAETGQRLQVGGRPLSLSYTHTHTHTL